MQKIIIIDGYNLIFRSFYAVPLLQNSKGENLNAVLGFIKMLIKISSFQFDKIAIAMDTGGRTFRDDIFDQYLEQEFIISIHKEYFVKFQELNISSNDLITMSLNDLIKKMRLESNINDIANKMNLSISKILVIIIFLNLLDKIKISDYVSHYKGTRISTPIELKSQFKIIHELIDTLQITKISKDGFEADDIIASVVKKAKNSNIFVQIISSDKDLFQLIEDSSVNLYNLSHKKIFTSKEVINQFSIEPKFLQTYLSLIGDSSDNIPGIYGIGPKAAIYLINTFGQLDNIIKKCNLIESYKIKNLISNAQNQKLAYLSYDLVSLKDDIPIIDFSMFSSKFNQIGLETFLKKYEIFDKFYFINQKKSSMHDFQKKLF